MSPKLQKNSLPNIPSLQDFVKISHDLFLNNLEHLLSEDNKAILESIVSITRDLRAEMIKVLNAKNNWEQRDSYLARSLNLFYTNVNAAIARLLEGHVSFSLMHSRVAIETAIILYIHHKGRVTFEDITQNKVNIYKKDIVSEFKAEQKKGGGKYPMLFSHTLEFLEVACMNGMHPNYEHVNHLSIKDKTSGKIHDWTHYPLESKKLNKLMANIYANIMPCICMYLDVFEEYMEENFGNSIVSRTIDLQNMIKQSLSPLNS